jgi:biotin transport system permease protein
MNRQWPNWRCKMLTLTLAPKTALHIVPVGAKLLALMLFGLALGFAPSWPWVLAAVLAVAVLYGAMGLKFAWRGFQLLRPLWPFLLVLALWHGFTNTKLLGLMIAGKLVAMVALANCVTLTSRFDALLSVIERLFTPFKKLGFSPEILALTLALVVRFTPVLLDKAAILRQAWRARSNKRPSWRLILPISLAALDDADHIATALRARGGFKGQD